jgi:hypothetical protein
MGINPMLRSTAVLSPLFVVLLGLDGLCPKLVNARAGELMRTASVADKQAARLLETSSERSSSSMQAIEIDAHGTGLMRRKGISHLRESTSPWQHVGAQLAPSGLSEAPPHNSVIQVVGRLGSTRHTTTAAAGGAGLAVGGVLLAGFLACKYTGQRDGPEDAEDEVKREADNRLPDNPDILLGMGKRAIPSTRGGTKPNLMSPGSASRPDSLLPPTSQDNLLQPASIVTIEDGPLPLDSNRAASPDRPPTGSTKSIGKRATHRQSSRSKSPRGTRVARTEQLSDLDKTMPAETTYHSEAGDGTASEPQQARKANSAWLWCVECPAERTIPVPCEDGEEIVVGLSGRHATVWKKWVPDDESRAMISREHFKIQARRSSTEEQFEFYLTCLSTTPMRVSGKYLRVADEAVQLNNDDTIELFDRQSGLSESTGSVAELRFACQSVGQ